LKKRATFAREIHIVDSVGEAYSMTSHVNIATSGGVAKSRRVQVARRYSSVLYVGASFRVKRCPILQELSGDE